tara:strand:- start:175 stop:504 length:330 start_codon:yes stop_codon:yes gene_type:complete
MNLNKTLKKLLADKEELLTSIELACKSIEFWEKKADETFQKMDDFESESAFKDKESAKKQYTALMQEGDRLMNRINFENTQLDQLEISILDLEGRIVKTLEKHAKKQKK